MRSRHLRWGWWSIAAFVGLGVVLESLHGFKIGGYLDVENSTRRHMWTLAHAHGTLIGLLHLAYAFTVGSRPGVASPVASVALSVAGLALPLGFFLGGAWFHAGDPGLGILLVPVGALAMVLASLVIALRVHRDR
jgi:hypothetical protein